MTYLATDADAALWIFLGEGHRGVLRVRKSCRPPLSNSHVPVLTLVDLTSSYFAFKKYRHDL